MKRGKMGFLHEMLLLAALSSAAAVIIILFYAVCAKYL